MNPDAAPKQNPPAHISVNSVILALLRSFIAALRVALTSRFALASIVTVASILGDALIFALSSPSSLAQTAAQLEKPLQVYFVDVEGGQATLFVTPDKHSLLIDTGWPGNNNRDADRIV